MKSTGRQTSYRRLAGYYSYPSALFLSAVGVAVETGEHGARGHHLAGLVPAVGVAQAGGVTLALLIQDRVQPACQAEKKAHSAFMSIAYQPPPRSFRTPDVLQPPEGSLCKR